MGYARSNQPSMILQLFIVAQTEKIAFPYYVDYWVAEISNKFRGILRTEN